MTLQEALLKCLPMVQDKTKHRWYQHVTELADRKYRPLITGEKADHLLEQFNKREDAAAFEQRKRLTKLVSPSITNTIMAPVRKVPRVKPVVNVATWGKGQEDKDKKLAQAVTDFSGGKSVDHYFGSVLLDQGAIDPNAFVLVLFDNFDARYKTAKCHPAIVTSTDAWNYEFANGELQWLLVHRDIKYNEERDKANPAGRNATISGKKESGTVEKAGHAFWMYTAMHQIYFRQVDKATVRGGADAILMDKSGQAISSGASLSIAQTGKYFYRASKSELYEVSFYEHKAGMVQAFRLGYIPDQTTGGDTMVNVWHAALPYLLKGIKAGSELDLSASLHAFLQKIQYANPCKGFDPPDGGHIDCNNGWEVGGERKCRKCGGTGWDVILSGQDHITLRLPRSKDDFLDLAQMVHYVPLPVEVLEWQDGYFDKLENKSYRAVYNTDRFRTGEAANTTATGDIIDLQSVYDTLKPVADWYSTARVYVYRLVASFVVGSDSVKTLNVAHEFPRNMRFETLNDRVALLKSLREAGASIATMSQVDADIQEDIYVDDAEAAKKARVRASFDPFLGRSEATIVSMISQDLTTKANKVLWTNFEQVFERCEAIAGKKMAEDKTPVNFYDMPREKQREIIDQVVAEMVEEVDADAPEPAQSIIGDDPVIGGASSSGDQTGDDMPDSPGQRATE